MSALPLDVWAMLVFCVLVFFGVSLYVLVYSLLQEETKMQILRSEQTVDTYSPRALRDLRSWIQAHPGDPDADRAREAYRACVEALQTTNRHVYDWTPADIDGLERL
jgi:hypothetical protein